MTLQYGFEKLWQREIREIQTAACLFRHAETGAELLSLSNDDSNKVFGITFRTPPPDSTGVAHILEHSVLCGSEKYPVKEPFVELLKGSLQTFLNAFTYPDKTCYPVASQNSKDFYNLIDVYLDAVFHPRISPLVLSQEGWHFEQTAASAPLTIKGVVYNEMKGAYSSPDSLLHRYSQQYLFPDSPYGLDSGGDPDTIPELTYEQFAGFHRRYYHPSNARVYFYGDDDPQERLRLIGDCLQGYARIDPRSDVAPQPRCAAARTVIKPYPAGEGDPAAHRGMLTVNWLLSETADIDMNLALTVLEHILLGMPASPLRKALLDSGLGSGIAGVGLETELRQMYLSTGLQGIDPDRAAEVESLVLSTIGSLAENGIDERTVKASMNTVEFRLRENNSGSFPRGLVLMLRALTTWLYNEDPLLLLAFEEPLERLKKRLAADPHLFGTLLKRCLIDNTHRTTVLLKPDSALAAEQQKQQQEQLAAARAALSPEQQEQIVATTLELQRMQQTADPPERLACIPRLARGDLDPEIKKIDRETMHRNETAILFHDVFTSSIAYVDIGFDLHVLPQHLVPYLQLFGRMLVEAGTKRYDFVELSQRISGSTGGIRHALYTSAAHGSTEAAAWLFLRAKAMRDRAGTMMELLGDLLHNARLDNRERFLQILHEERAAQEQKIIPMGHLFVGRRLRSHFHQADWADELMSGIDYLLFLRELAGRLEAGWEEIRTHLEEIRSLLVSGHTMIVNTTADRHTFEALQPALHEFVDTLPAAAPPRAAWTPKHAEEAEGLIVPSLVNYVGKAANLYSLGYSHHGSISVITHLLRTSWLWEKVRVEGGAYGAFSAFDRMSGTLVCASYRDPNLLATLAVFDKAAGFLGSGSLHADEIEKSIIGAVGDMDAPLLPDAMGYVSLQRYLSGITDDERQRIRSEILATGKDQVRDFAGTLQAFARSGIVKVIGSAEAVRQANAQKEGFLHERHII